MDKFTLNNEIVSMRHDVRRGKVHTINKLVRTSRKLKAKKGSEKDIEKNQRKAARFMEEIIIMKSLKDDEVSKFALTNLKAPDDILNDLKISLREKALARLSGHPNLITRVSQFRTKFPGWEETLPTLLEQLGAKRKKKKAKTKPQKPEQKISPLKVKSESVNNSVEPADLNEKQNMPSNPKVDTLSTSKSKTVKSKRKHKEVEVGNSDVSNSSVKALGKGIAEVKRFSEILKSNDSGDSSSEDNYEIVDSIDDNKTVSDTSDEKTVSDIPDKKTVSGTPNQETISDTLEEMTVDPFFMCEDGETEYVTSVKRIVDENGYHGEKNMNIVKQSSWKSDSRSGFNRRGQRRGQILEPKNFNVKGYQHNDFKFDSKNKKHIRPQDRKEVQTDRREVQTTAKEPIHPSWEAKKRLKEQQHALTAFQGKKIKFED